MYHILFILIVLGIVAFFRVYGEVILDWIGRDNLRRIRRISFYLIFVGFGVFIFGLTNFILYPEGPVEVEEREYTIEDPRVRENTRRTQDAIEYRKDVYVGKRQSGSFSESMTYAELWKGLREGDWYTINFACLVFGFLIGTLSLFTCIISFVLAKKA